MSYQLILCIIAIIAAIVIGNVWKLNTGIVAAVFAFIIGTLTMGLTADKIVGFWPDKIFFFIIACGLFFGFAVENGTVDALGKNLLYLTNGRSALIPWIIWIIGFIVGAMGAGVASITIIGPLCFPVAAAAGISPLMTATSIMCGCIVGFNNPFTGQMGVTIMNLISDAAGYPDEAPFWSMDVWISRVVLMLLLTAAVYIITKSYKAEKVEVQKPEKMSPIQRKTMTLLLTATFFMVVSMLLATVFSNVAWLKAVSRFAQPQAIMTICAVIAMLMNLADTNKVIKSLPMNTALMIAGFTLMMGVAREAGLVESVGAALGSGVIPGWLMSSMCLLLGGVMALFCSGTAVVFPLMFPLISTIAQATGADPLGMVIGLTAGSVVSSLTPFTTGGALVIAGCPDAEAQESLSTSLIWLSVIALIVTAIVSLTGFLSIFDFTWSI
ncbi:MAG: SLC13 family permease [Christensenellales bacterium]|jgi:hypothetical protein